MPNVSITNLFLVRSAHLNSNGSLFGGHLMAEIDVTGYCLLRRLYPTRNFVTRAANIEFIGAARLGDMVELTATLERIGTSSLQVHLQGRVGERPVAEARLVYVRINAAGEKAPNQEEDPA